MKKFSTKELTAIALMTALTSFGSMLKLPFYPVPISLQSLFPLIAGMLFSPMAAAFTQAAYLLLGLLGLPLFAYGGGPAYVLQPSFGYLVAMPASAALVAVGMRGLAKPPKLAGLFLLSGAGAIFLLVFGTIWLYFSFHWIAGRPIPLTRILWLGMGMFIPGEMIKAAAAALAGRKIYHLFHP